MKLHKALVGGAMFACMFIGNAHAAEPTGWPFAFTAVVYLAGQTGSGTEYDPLYSAGNKKATVFCNQSADALTVDCDFDLNLRIDAITYVPTQTNVFMFVGGLPPIEPTYNLMASWDGNFGGMLTYSPGQISLDANAAHNDPSGRGSIWYVTASFPDNDEPTNCTWGTNTFSNWCKLGGPDSQITTPHIRLEGHMNIITTTAMFDPWIVQGILAGTIIPVTALPPEFTSMMAKAKKH